RRLRPAAEARPEAGRDGLCGGLEVPDVLAPGGPRRADRPAIDARRDDADEKPPVEPRIAREPRPVTDPGVQRFHRVSVSLFQFCGWPFSDMNVPAPRRQIASALRAS